MTTDTLPRPALRVAAADVRGVLSRLRGVLVLDVATLSITPAHYDPKAAEFRDLDGELLGPDDGTLIVLRDHYQVAAIVEEAGRPCDAAALLTRQLADEARRGLL